MFFLAKMEYLAGNEDPICHLLSWHWSLITDYHLPEHARKLQNSLETLEKMDLLNDSTVTNILCVLLRLRGLPKSEEKIMVHI